jgi:hypothetical protein
MFENYRMKKILENELEKTYPEFNDNVQNMVNKNINYGTIKKLLTKVYDEIWINKWRYRVTGLARFIFRTYFSEEEINRREVLEITDRCYTAGFWDGYREKEAEELAELILTEPYNRVSEN